jgi:predicted metalloprotease
LLLKYIKNGTGGIAKLELGGERMCKEVVLRPFLVFVQGTIDDQLEGRGRGGGSLSVRHEGERQ